MIIPWWLSALAGAISASILAFFIADWDIHRIEVNNDKAIASQIVFDIKKCELEKQITKGANDDLQNENATLKSQLDTAKLRVGTRCIMPVTKPAGLGHAADSPAKLPTPDAGITTTALLDFAASCEQTRLYLINLRKFDATVWANK